MKSDIANMKITLLDIINNVNNNEYYTRFTDTRYIPTMTTTNKEVFLETVCTRYSNTGSTHIKFLMIDKRTNEITNDSGYPFMKIPKEGYLVRLVLPKRVPISDMLELSYIVDINNISFNEYIDNGVNKIVGFNSIEDINSILKNPEILNMDDISKENLIYKYFNEPFSLNLKRRR
jgi:hypothetical protein